MRWLLIVGCLLGGALGVTQVHGQQVATHFADGPCPFAPGKGFTPGVNLRCGTLTTPMNPDSASLATVRLAVAIFRTPSVHRQDDPVVFLQGGPGFPIVKPLGQILSSRNALRLPGDHDLILPQGHL